MSNPVIKGQKLKCNKGSAPSQLKVTSQQHVKVKGELQATEDDKQANTNIVPFGSCSSKNGAGCSPSPEQWKKTSVFKIEGKKELTTDSFCMCKTGGKITIVPLAVTEFIKNTD